MIVQNYGPGMIYAWDAQIQCHYCESTLLVGVNDLVAKTNMDMVSGFFEITNVWYYYIDNEGRLPTRRNPNAKLRFELTCAACAKRSFFTGEIPPQIVEYLIKRPTLNLQITEAL